MDLSKELIKNMGFKEFPDSDVLEVRFNIIKVYFLRGLSFEDDCEGKISEVITLFDRCTVAIAQSVNDASNLLAGNVFFDDEKKWLAESQAKPPFLLIYFNGKNSIELKGGYRQEINGCINTYDAFHNRNKEIEEWEERLLPSIITSLTINLSTLDMQVDLVPIKSITFGVTKEDIIVLDSKFIGNFLFYTPYKKNINEINNCLKKSKDMLPTLINDICKSFYAALNEPDRMKKFLFYFQFLERYTHSTYKTINYNDNAKRIFKFPQHINEKGFELFKEIFNKKKNITQRFNWCSIISWSNIGNNDVEIFIEAKKIRDKISHGEYVKEQDLPVDKVEKLALKILGTKDK